MTDPTSHSRPSAYVLAQKRSQKFLVMEFRILKVKNVVDFLVTEICCPFSSGEIGLNFVVKTSLKIFRLKRTTSKRYLSPSAHSGGNLISTFCKRVRIYLRNSFVCACVLLWQLESSYNAMPGRLVGISPRLGGYA